MTKETLNVDEYIEQMDWVCEQIKSLTERLDMACMKSQIDDSTSQLVRSMNGITTIVGQLNARLDLVEQRVIEETSDWMCEEIKSLTKKLDDTDIICQISSRRLDDLYPHRIDHHIRLLKLEEAQNDN